MALTLHHLFNCALSSHVWYMPLGPHFKDHSWRAHPAVSVKQREWKVKNSPLVEQSAGVIEFLLGERRGARSHT